MFKLQISIEIYVVMYSILCVEIAPASFIMAALYIFRYNLQFRNNVINNKTKVDDLSRI